MREATFDRTKAVSLSLEIFEVIHIYFFSFGEKGRRGASSRLLTWKRKKSDAVQFSEEVILPERQPEMVTVDVTALPSERSDCLNKTEEKFQTEQAESEAFT